MPVNVSVKSNWAKPNQHTSIAQKIHTLDYRWCKFTRKSVYPNANKSDSRDICHSKNDFRFRCFVVVVFFVVVFIARSTSEKFWVRKRTSLTEKICFLTKKYNTQNDTKWKKKKKKNETKQALPTDYVYFYKVSWKINLCTNLGRQRISTQNNNAFEPHTQPNIIHRTRFMRIMQGEQKQKRNKNNNSKYVTRTITPIR